MAALELRDVVVDYERRGGGRVRAVAGASLSVEPGRIAGLVGESGCGKSTLARAAVGLVKTASGSVVFEGREVETLGRRGRSRALSRLQLVFQNPYSSLNPRRKVGAQLADALATLGLMAPAGRAGRVRELCELVGLPAAAAERYPHEFSGGQRQRIAIARTLAAEPSVIVLDEPLASLDASGAGAAREPARQPLTRARARAAPDLPRPRDRPPHRRQRLGDVPRCDGRDGRHAPALGAPLHPYSEALIKAIPHADGAGALPDALPGEVPDPGHPPAGCRFHPAAPSPSHAARRRCRGSSRCLWATGASSPATSRRRAPPGRASERAGLVAEPRSNSFPCRP